MIKHDNYCMGIKKNGQQCSYKSLNNTRYCKIHSFEINCLYDGKINSRNYFDVLYEYHNYINCKYEDFEKLIYLILKEIYNLNVCSDLIYLIFSFIKIEHKEINNYKIIKNFYMKRNITINNFENYSHKFKNIEINKNKIYVYYPKTYKKQIIFYIELDEIYEWFYIKEYFEDWKNNYFLNIFSSYISEFFHLVINYENKYDLSNPRIGFIYKSNNIIKNLHISSSEDIEIWQKRNENKIFLTEEFIYFYCKKIILSIDKYYKELVNDPIKKNKIKTEIYERESIDLLYLLKKNKFRTLNCKKIIKHRMIAISKIL